MEGQEKVKIIFVGVGGFGSYLWKITHEYVDQNLFKVVGIVDPYRKSAECYKEIEESKIPEYDTLEELFEEGKVEADLAMIASPIHRHCEQTMICLEHGLHVLCEKPAAALVKDLDSMIAKAKEKNRILGIGFQWTYFDEIIAMKKDLLNEKFGKIKCAKSMVNWPRNRSYYKSSWKGRIKNDKGEYVLDSVLQNATAHYLHNLLFLCGKSLNRGVYLQEIKAGLYRAKDIQNFDTISLEGKIGDARLLYMASHVVDKEIDPIFEIRCEKGRFGIDLNKEDAKFFAEDSNGHREYYGEGIKPGYHNSIKITKILKWVQEFKESGTVPEIICDGITARPHLETINRLAFGAKIHNFPQSVIKEYYNEEYQGHFVPGLNEAIYECYIKDKPLSESGFEGILPEEDVKSYDEIKDQIVKG